MRTAVAAVGKDGVPGFRWTACIGYESIRIAAEDSNAPANITLGSLHDSHIQSLGSIVMPSIREIDHGGMGAGLVSLSRCPKEITAS